MTASSRTDLSSLKMEKLFSTLKANEYEILWKKASMLQKSDLMDQGSATKLVAVRADSGRHRFARPSRSADSTMEGKLSRSDLQKKNDELIKQMEEMSSKCDWYRKFSKSRRSPGESSKTQVGRCF